MKFDDDKERLTDKKRRNINALKIDDDALLDVDDDALLDVDDDVLLKIDDDVLLKIDDDALLKILTEIITTKLCLIWSLIIVFLTKAVIKENKTTANEFVIEDNETARNLFEKSIIDENKSTKDFSEENIIDENKTTNDFFERFDFRRSNLIVLNSIIFKRFDNVNVFWWAFS